VAENLRDFRLPSIRQRPGEQRHQRHGGNERYIPLREKRRCGNAAIVVGRGRLGL
jgi:hypothetical protein